MAITNLGKSPATDSGVATTNTGALSMVTTLFFVWGFLTSLNDILIPHLKSIFELNFAEAMLVQFVFFSGYFLFAVPAGKLVERIGYKATMIAGLVVMAAGALLFLPAASVPAFTYFLAALIVLAIGITALQVSANPYVSVLGPSKTASSRLNLAQAFNSLGTTVAPSFGSWLILSAVAKTPTEMHSMEPHALQGYRLHEAATVKLPYLLIAVALIALAGVIWRFKLPVITAVEGPAHGGNPDRQALPSIWRQRHLVLGVIAIFVYVGAEVAIGSFLVNYFSQPEIGGMTQQMAANYVSFYWGLAMIGRFIGSALLQRIATNKMLAVVAVCAGMLVLITMLTFGHVAMWSIILVGLFNSIMFPSIFTLGIEGLGPLTGEGSGLLVTGIVGGAIIPVIQGALADHMGLHHAFILPVLCYIYIAYYGWRGSKPQPLPSERSVI